LDDKRLRQVLLNLLGNAVKFTERGEVRLSVEHQGNTATRARLRFSVRDTGIGIAGGDLATIFIPFHQLDNPITRAEGSGLGLTISQRLVRLMGSQLKLESRPGQGSRFWFDLDLPLLTGSETEAATPPAAEAKPVDEAFALPRAETLNALLEQARRHNVLGVRALLKEL
jgi:signal transduction histidine kinase